MFLQRVHASVKYQIKLDFGCESLSKVLEHIPDIVGMNYTPSTRFWAVSTKDAVVDNKPDFLSEIDTSVTTFRLKWHPDATVDWKELKQSISTTWKVPSEHIQVNGLGNLIQAEIKKDHLVNASVSKVLYVNSVTIQNLSFNPRLGKPTLLTKVTELIQQKCSTMIPTSSGGSIDPKVLDNLVSKDDFNNLKKDFEKRINELSLENSSLKTDVANLTSNVAKLSTELENLNTITANLNKEAVFSKSQPAQLSDLSDKTTKLFKVFDDLTKSVDSLKDELLKMSSTNSTEHTEFQSKISKLDSSNNAVEKTNQSQQKCIDEVICPTIDRHSLELKKHLSFIKGVENRIDEVCTLNKPNSDKQAILLGLIKQERLDIACIQESHWKPDEIKDNITKCAKFFSPCKVYASHADPKDKSAGIITIVKGTLQRKIISFEEIIQGRLSVLECDHGLVNVINWYGYHKTGGPFNKLLNRLSELIDECMFHNEHIVILGDLNINTLYGKIKKKAKILKDWLELYNLSDLTPTPTRPSFKLSRGSDRPYLTRPDHIISSFHAPSRLWDVEMFLQHKMLCVELPLFNCAPLPCFQSKFDNVKFNLKGYNDALDSNNAKISNFELGSFQDSLTDPDSLSTIFQACKSFSTHY
ncbi:predicted protein [Naegleria gruberi]|uniref:Predicted protein n=1 Tax=Naegleria gruberi TaxID=5762 RepID=D2V3S2_NAEGR|nr:uncharacterized protein NAEGRDRAFT_46456 [Naegleria gruberi]EFC48404.1 predicted protein [Naegleria gruberi]|eukprot:XP_002681148.1 predicted protein [Naegleria gruberi strain NEG-M]